MSRMITICEPHQMTDKGDDCPWCVIQQAGMDYAEKVYEVQQLQESQRVLEAECAELRNAARLAYEGWAQGNDIATPLNALGRFLRNIPPIPDKGTM